MSVLSSWIGGTRRLVLDVGHNGLLLGPVRRAFVEPASAVSDELLRLLLCYYGKHLWHMGLIAGSCGNLSARLSRRDVIYITPRSANKARLSTSDIQRVSLEEPEATDLERVSAEFPMHRACYVGDGQVGAVIHTHAPALTAVGILGHDLGRLLPEVEASLGRIRRVPYAVSGSEALAHLVGDAVAEGASLILLERHGAVSVGRDLVDAYDRMEFGELSAKTALLATTGALCSPH